MATLDGTWANSYVGIWTETGIYRAAYAPGPREEVVIAKPDDQKQAVKTPSLGGFFLAVEANELVIYYIEHDTRVERRKGTGIMCGKQTFAALPQATGPIGPAGGVGPKGDKGDRGPAGPAGKDGLDGEDAFVDDETIQRIADAVVKYPAEPGHFGIPDPLAQSGLYSQDAITVLLMNQAVQQLFQKAVDEAVRNLKAGGYQPVGV